LTAQFRLFASAGPFWVNHSTEWIGEHYMDITTAGFAPRCDMDLQYDAWNQAIGRYFFKPDHAGRPVFLTVDDTVLQRIRLDDTPPLHFDSPDAAAHDFAAAVRREICQRGWTSGFPRADSYPNFLGLLALQVLAVFKMRNDESWQEKAYWGRLRELLGDTQSTYMPLGLKPDQHQELWRQGLARWANHLQKERWGSVWLPSEEQRGEWHVILPKSQALLRLADLQRLPFFYHQASFRPGEDLPVTEIQRAIQPHLHNLSLFQRHAVNVLSDERSLSACAQICDHLRNWEGEASVGRARLWLQLSAFDPPELHGGLTEGTARLQEILGRSEYCYIADRVFRPIRREYSVTILDTFTEIWEERRHATPGDDVLLLVRSTESSLRQLQVSRFVAASDTLQCYISEDMTEQPDRTPLRGLPSGWCALHFRVREDLSASLLNWLSEWLHYDPVQIIGGLRLNKNTWMAGAGPTLLVRDPQVKHVLINGDAYPVVAGRVTPLQAPCLNEPGTYGVRLDGRADGKRVAIAQAEVNTELLSLHGWKQKGDAWPWPTWLENKSMPDSPDSDVFLRGPVFLGTPVPVNRNEPPVERQWLELALRIRDRRFAPLLAFRLGQDCSIKGSHVSFRQKNRLIVIWTSPSASLPQGVRRSKTKKCWRLLGWCTMSASGAVLLRQMAVGINDSWGIVAIVAPWRYRISSPPHSNARYAARYSLPTA
jgi:hypothetical protein